MFPGAGFVELAFEAAIMGCKVQPLVLRNLNFKSPLLLNDNTIQKIRCTKETSNAGKGEKFEVKHVTDQGGLTLSTAEIFIFSTEASDDTLSLSEAREYTYIHLNLWVNVPNFKQ